MLSFDEILSRFGPHTRHGQDYRVLCPVHGDTTPSLDIAEGDNGTPLFFCHSQRCLTEDILRAVGLSWPDVLPDRPGRNGHGPEAWDVAYEYRDRQGTLRYRVLRRGHGQDKVIRQQAADGSWGLKGKGIEPIPYRLNELTGPTVLIAEGEKAVDAIWGAGYEATTNSGGSGMWRDSDTHALIACGITHAYVLPDNDEAGAKHADKVEESLQRLGITTARIVLPDLPPKGDAYDYLRTHTPAQFVAALEPPAPALPPMLATIEDAVDVSAEGRKLAADGIQYVIDGILPDYGMLGFLIAFAKVGKSTLGQFLVNMVATGQPFLGRETRLKRVLVIAAEDPPEYVAWMARHLEVPRDRIGFYRAPIQLDDAGLELIVNTVIHGGYGLVVIASWQAVISTLVKDENDNAGSVAVVERVKRATRRTSCLWLIDGHSGKGESQDDGADPLQAMRGASAAAGAADFMLSLRYVNRESFSSRRRLSGRGRFVVLEPMIIDYSIQTGRYELISDTGATDYADTTWAIIVETNALGVDWAGTGVIAARAGMCAKPGDASGATRDRVYNALKKRPGVERKQDHKGVWRYRRVPEDFDGDED